MKYVIITMLLVFSSYAWPQLTPPSSLTMVISKKSCINTILANPQTLNDEQLERRACIGEGCGMTLFSTVGPLGVLLPLALTGPGGCSVGVWATGMVLGTVCASTLTGGSSFLYGSYYEEELKNRKAESKISRKEAKKKTVKKLKQQVKDLQKERDLLLAQPSLPRNYTYDPTAYSTSQSR